MRGALDEAKYGNYLRGIIPADAGSTVGNGSLGFNAKDHPRGCGEHWWPWYDLSKYQGSSPRMRGAL